ncbi:hypothetical protein QBC44DRAFT_305501 [Cladorrhinum sp. PSN332]|nr:hypothetical protein QBC44DRAFT_305501 [Cladorrhinum sp. PSN332]
MESQINHPAVQPQLSDTSVAAIVVVVLALCTTTVAVTYAVAINRRRRSTATTTTMTTMGQMEAARFRQHLQQHDHDHYYHTSIPLSNLSRTSIVATHGSTSSNNSLPLRRQRERTAESSSPSAQPSTYSPLNTALTVAAPRPIPSRLASAQSTRTAASRSTLDMIPEARSSITVDATSNGGRRTGSAESSARISLTPDSSADNLTIIIRTGLRDDHSNTDDEDKNVNRPSFEVEVQRPGEPTKIYHK